MDLSPTPAQDTFRRELREWLRANLPWEYGVGLPPRFTELDEEVAFLESIATQLAIGYQYTRIYTDKKREAETTKALLEIANTLNARSDFGEVSSVVLERALALLTEPSASLPD